MSTSRGYTAIAWSWIIGLINALGAMLLWCVGLWILAHAHGGMVASRERGEFASGMLVAASGVGAIAGAVVLTSLAVGCCLVYRHIRRHAQIGSIGWIFLYLASIPPLALVMFVLWRFR